MVSFCASFREKFQGVSNKCNDECVLRCTSQLYFYRYQLSLTSHKNIEDGFLLSLDNNEYLTFTQKTLISSMFQE
jgi:hypothetical protein